MPNVPRPTRDRARSLRRAMSLPEVLLWQQLRPSPAGLRFRRQHPLGPYVLDFHCSGRGLAVEVDGAFHNFAGQAERDRARDAWLAGQGVTVMRVAAVDVLADVEAVVAAVVAMAGGLPERR